MPCHSGGAKVALRCGSSTERSRISGTSWPIVAGMRYAWVHCSAARMLSTSSATTRGVTTFVPACSSTGMPKNWKLPMWNIGPVFRNTVALSMSPSQATDMPMLIRLVCDSIEPHCLPLIAAV